jgi:hypothetical protein
MFDGDAKPHLGHVIALEEEFLIGHSSVPMVGGNLACQLRMRGIARSPDRELRYGTNGPVSGTLEHSFACSTSVQEQSLEL